MEQASSARRGGGAWWAAVPLCIAGAAMLVLAWFSVVLYGYCEDACDAPDVSGWAGVVLAATFALIGIVMVSFAVLLFIPSSTAPGAAKVMAVGVASSVLLVAGTSLVASVLPGEAGL